MGQLCCFPFSRAEEKINLFQSTPRARTSVKRGAESDDAELQRISRKLVEEAVLRAVQQYKEETHHHPNGGGPAEQAAPPSAADGVNATAVATTTVGGNPDN